MEVLPEVSALLNLEELSMKDFLVELTPGAIAEMVLLKPETSPEDLNSSSVLDEDVLEGFMKQRATRLGSEIIKNPEDPVYPLVKEYSDVCEIINAFFTEKAKSGMAAGIEVPALDADLLRSQTEREVASGSCSNKLNNATVPAQIPIPCKDVLLNNMSGCTLYSALDLVDGYYQILMWEGDIPLTATYFDDIWVHSRAEDGQTAMEIHLKHLRRVFEVMRPNKLYANIDKCVFAAEEITALGCFVSRVGVRSDPGKVKVIAACPTTRSQKGLRTWLGLAYYLHKYSTEYAELARPLLNLLKKDADWVGEQQHQDAFDSIKAGLQHAPVLVLPDENKSFSVVCDTSDYEIDCALLQKDDEGLERVISFQSRQLNAAERNDPVHDKQLLAMKYTLVKYRPHLSQRMARWLSFFAEYNFRVKYKPGKPNVLAGALSRRPDYELAHVSQVTTDLYDWIRLAYQGDENYTPQVRFLYEVKGAKVDRLCLDSGRNSTDTSWAMGYSTNSMSLDFVFGLPADDKGNTGILVFVYRLSKMERLAPVRDKVTGKHAAQLFLDSVFRLHGLPETIVSDRDPRFTGAFWDTLFQLLGN
ncbi:Reverse transcriptase [Phytophthora palmivora]|uniref:Reverse transcriptase n=1 Tax=Phytophthora palmivora TaxID=4796 RepID=A0A2P4XG67_9STRA|nr:Reverse transcriptase [Phytophthora palmivora]